MSSQRWLRVEVDELAQLWSRRLPWVQPDELDEEPVERLKRAEMSTEHVEWVEGACSCLHSHQT